MTAVFMIAVALQAAVILTDELCFHRRRVLPLWERLGHPLDTLALLVCLGFALYLPPSPWATPAFIALAVFSTLFITKDEWVHATRCTAAEHWLHALLFILHPLVLVSTYFIWPSLHDLPSEVNTPRGIVSTVMALMSMFLIYQVTYWNWLWPKNTKQLRVNP